MNRPTCTLRLVFTAASVDVQVASWRYRVMRSGGAEWELQPLDDGPDFLLIADPLAIVEVES